MEISRELSKKIKLYNRMLYESQYSIPKKGDYTEILYKVIFDEELLKGAIQKKKNKWGNYVLYGNAIAESILLNYEEVSEEIYNELISMIYSNEDIARIALDGGYSFLLMSLYNQDLILTKKQKSFALKEAMNQKGTTQYRENGKINNQIHGMNSFDIRYWILMNPNWDMEEKATYIYEFYKDNELYDKILEDIEWDIVNDSRNYQHTSESILDKTELFEYSFDDLLTKYKNKEDADFIYEEITMCRLFHEMRPAQWELTDTGKSPYTKK